ncbi:MAG: condensation domain-containing protein, partial [Acidobacteriota bacterium]
MIARLHEAPVAYNIPGLVRFQGPLSARSLAASVHVLSARHESLRTVFGSQDGAPWQAPQGSGTVRPGTVLCTIDLSGLGAETSARQARRLTAAEGRRCFDLERGPVSRALLIRLSAEDHHLVVTWHHIAADGWSLRIWLRELMALYRSAVDNRPHDLAPPPIQPIDFAVWQRARFEAGAWQDQLRYWRDELAGVPSLSTLPTDRPRPAVQQMLGAKSRFVLPQGLLESLAAAARQDGATLFTLLATALGGLLLRHGAGEDVVIGSPVAGRNRSEVQELVGCFVNTVALRPRLGGDPPFEEGLRLTREVVLGALANQDLPFEKLVEDLQPERSLGYSPLFQVMLAFE